MTLFKTIIDVTAVLIAAGAAIAAFMSAREAKRAATETRAAAQAALLSALLNEHGSDETLEAHRVLRDWSNAAGDGFADEFGRARDLSNPDFLEIDSARRRLAIYLYKIHQLHHKGLLDDALVEAVLPRTTAEFCLDVVEPLEAAVRSNHDSAPFLWISGRYDMPRNLGAFPASHGESAA